MPCYKKKRHAIRHQLCIGAAAECRLLQHDSAAAHVYAGLIVPYSA